jgi:hypothetical protein
MSLTKIKTKYKQLENLRIRRGLWLKQILNLLLKYYNGEQDLDISEVVPDGFFITAGFYTAILCPIDYIIEIITKHHKFTDEDLEMGSI